MIKLDQIRADKLVELACARFDSAPSEAELKVLRDSASSLNPDVPAADAPLLPIRAEFVRWLMTDLEAAPQIDQRGLRAWGVTVRGPLDLQGCCLNAHLSFVYSTFEQVVDLRYAQTRALLIMNSTLCAGLLADGVIVRGPAFFRQVQSTGQIRLLGAHIDGDLSCTGAQLVGAECTLFADRAHVNGGVYLNEGFASTGEIRLPGAEIGEVLDCSGAILGAEGRSLDGDRIKVEGGVYLNAGSKNPFVSAGEIRLLGAHLKSNLECDGAQLLAPGKALSLDGAKVEGAVFLRAGFECRGEIRMPGADISSDLVIFGASTRKVACKNLSVGGDLIWYGVKALPGASLDLMGAKVKVLRDDRDSWPAEGTLSLNGFEYDDLVLHHPPKDEQLKNGLTTADELPLTVADRIEWLERQAPDGRTAPQPWIELRDLLERSGDHAGAKHAMYTLSCLNAKESHAPVRAAKISFAWIEEAPLRIGWSMAAVFLLGWLVFGYAGARGALAPTDSGAYTAFTQGQPMPGAYPVLNPLAYTFDNAVPLFKLGQDDKWAPDRRFPSQSLLTNYWFLMWFRWFLTLSGWFQATVFGAALFGLFQD